MYQGWPVLSQRCDNKGEKGVCNHYTCDSFPASHSYWLSKENYSLLKVLAELGQGSITVIPEATPLEPRQMENDSLIDLLGAS